jgi:hypothetical protein
MTQQPSAVPSLEIDRSEAAVSEAASAADQESPKSRLERHGRLIVGELFVAAFVLGWCGGFGSHWGFDYFGPHSTSDYVEVHNPTDAIDFSSIVEQIIKVESDGDPNAKNKRSSATGLGQFLDETWLRLIRTHRPDLTTARGEGEILELRRDPNLAREITARFTEGNAEILRRRGLPVTRGTLYLAHFAGAAGAVAILSALEQADAASIMASADASGRTSREKLVKSNPFLEHLTVADLKSWADRRMRIRF